MPGHHAAGGQAGLGPVLELLDADRATQAVQPADEPDDEAGRLGKGTPSAQMISSWTEVPSRAAVTLSSVRSALATLPLRPMTLPMSSSATCSSMTVPSSSWTS